MSKSNKDQLKFENELRKLQLLAEQGAKVETSSSLDPTMEKGFLDYIEKFNQAAQARKTITIAEKLGNPDLPAVEQVPHDQLEELLKVIEQLLHQHYIQLNVLYEVSPKELYRFIVEDFLPYEMNDIDIPGSFSVFTYEDFYPNYEEDLKREGKDIVQALLKLDKESIKFLLQFPIRLGEGDLSFEDFYTALNRELMPYIDLTIEAIELKSQHLTEHEGNNVFTIHYSEGHVAEVKLFWEIKYGFNYCVGVTLTSVARRC